jgi:hypothetical protein
MSLSKKFNDQKTYPRDSSRVRVTHDPFDILGVLRKPLSWSVHRYHQSRTFCTRVYVRLSVCFFHENLTE